MPALPRRDPWDSSQSPDSQLEPLATRDVPPQQRHAESSNAKRQSVPSLHLSSDALTQLVPIEGLPILGLGGDDTEDTPTVEKRIDTHEDIDSSLLPAESSGAKRRSLPSLHLSSDALTQLVPIEGLPILGLGGDDTEDTPTVEKRIDTYEDNDSSPLPSKREEAESSTRRSLPSLHLSSDSLMQLVPIEGLPILGLGGDDTEDTPTVEKRIDTHESIDSSLLPAKREEAESSPPIVQVNSLRLLDKLGKLNLLDPLAPPGSSKRDDSGLLRLDVPSLLPELSELGLAPPAPPGSSKRDNSESQPSLLRVDVPSLLPELSELGIAPPASSKRDDSESQPPLLHLDVPPLFPEISNLDIDPLQPSSSRKALFRRQNSIAIPAQYAGLNSGPAPGAVAGIVLGSVAGFLLIVWLLWLVSNGGGVMRSSTYIEDDVVVSRRRSRSPGNHRSHRSQRTEMASRSPRRERVIRQERIVRDRSAAAPRETSRLRDTVIIDDNIRPERRVEGDDIVEVIEEHSSVGVPPPRRKTRRSSGYRRGDYSDL